MPARVALFGGSPYRIIVLAQAANVLFLPVVMVLLLIIANRAEIMGRFRNSRLTSSRRGLLRIEKFRSSISSDTSRP